MGTVRSMSLGRMAGAKSGVVTASWSWLEPPYQMIAERYLRFTALLNASSTSHPIVITDTSTGFLLQTVRVIFTGASSSGTLMIEKLTGTQAPGAGVEVLTGTISLSGTINTALSGTLIGVGNDRRLLSDGDRFGVKLAGTLTGLANCLVSLSLSRTADVSDFIVYTARRRCRIMNIYISSDDWRTSSGGTFRFLRVVNFQNPASGSALGPTVNIATDIVSAYANYDYPLAPASGNNYCILEAGDRIAIDMSADVRSLGIAASIELLPLPDQAHWLSG